MRMQKEDGRIEEYTGCSSNRAILYEEINQTYKINLFHETLRFRGSRVQRFVKYVQTRLITDFEYESTINRSFQKDRIGTC